MAQDERDLENENLSRDDCSDVDVSFPVGVEVGVPGSNRQLFKTVLTEGTGPRPLHGAQVSVHYVGTLAANGSKFDSSRDRGNLFQFAIGTGQVIRGWDQGVATMQVGEKAILKCLPDFGYGKSGAPPNIPPNATLKFEVELFSWTNCEDVSPQKDKTLMKSTRVAGHGYEAASFEATVEFCLATLEPGKASHESASDTVLVEVNDMVAVMGEANLPPGVEEALTSFRAGETAVVDVDGALIADDDAKWNLTAGQPAKYRIAVRNISEIRPCAYNSRDKLVMAITRKDQGNGFFKQQLWTKALAKYSRALEFIEYDDCLDGSERADAKVIRIALQNNLAQVNLTTKKFAQAIEHCDKALSVDEYNVKALFRRAKAHHGLGDWNSGLTDLKKLLEIDCGNSDAERELAEIQKKVGAHRAKERAAYKNMFALV